MSWATSTSAAAVRVAAGSAAAGDADGPRQAGAEAGAAAEPPPANARDILEFLVARGALNHTHKGQLKAAVAANETHGGADTRQRMKAWTRVVEALGADVVVGVLKSAAATHDRACVLLHVPTRHFFLYSAFHSEKETYDARYAPRPALVAAFRAACEALGATADDGGLDFTDLLALR